MPVYLRQVPLWADSGGAPGICGSTVPTWAEAMSTWIDASCHSSRLDCSQETEQLQSSILDSKVCRTKSGMPAYPVRHESLNHMQIRVQNTAASVNKDDLMLCRASFANRDGY